MIEIKRFSSLSDMIAFLEKGLSYFSESLKCPEDRENFLVEMISEAKRRNTIDGATARALYRHFDLPGKPDVSTDGMTYDLGVKVHSMRFGDVTIPDQIAAHMQAWDAVNMPVVAIDADGRYVEVALTETDA